MHEIPDEERAGAVAAATGLTLLRGRPGDHFDESAATLPIRIEMRGAPHGRDVVLEACIACPDTRGRLAVALEVRAPRFELTRRWAAGIDASLASSLRPPSVLPPGAGVVSLGDPELDARLELRTEDPRLGLLLAPAAAVISDAPDVHVVGDASQLELRASGPAVRALASAERHLYVLEEMARALEGRASIARLPDGARSRAVALRCDACGAPAAVIPGTVHHPIRVRCRHCSAEVALSPELESELRAARAHASVEQWANRVVRTVDRDRGAARSSTITRLGFVAFGMWSMLAFFLAGAAGLVVRLLAPSSTLLAGSLSCAVGALLPAVAAVVIARIVSSFHAGAARRGDAVGSTSLAPTGGALPCSACGAPVPVASALSRCAHCGVDHLPDHDRLGSVIERMRGAGRAAQRRAAAAMPWWR